MSGVPLGHRGALQSTEENHSARNLQSWLEVLYTQLVCHLLKSPAYTAGTGASGREPCSSQMIGGL